MRARPQVSPMHMRNISEQRFRRTSLKGHLFSLWLLYPLHYARCLSTFTHGASSLSSPQKTFASSAWWKEQSKDLFALTEEHELGLMSSMVTITHNDLVPEQLANMRRGPFAAPTESEKVEYLMTRVRTDRQRHQFENYGLEHVLSYQRRISATKVNFMRRNQKGPLGIVRDFWDRTIEGVTLRLG